MISEINIPILLITFNRLDSTKKVFEQIRKLRPKKLYLYSDGHRVNNENEKQKVLEVRRFISDSVDWDCEINKLFGDSNKGCKYAPQEAISWLFKNEEMGIILEDDCLPSTSFFKYATELLHHFRTDYRVFTVSGFNAHDSVLESKTSYYFSKIPITWGWATWKTRWDIHLKNMQSFTEDSKKSVLNEMLYNKAAVKSLLSIAKESYEDKLDAWDYLWHYSCLINNALTTVPNENLIQNLGFGPDATHTHSANKMFLKNAVDIKFPLMHPNVILPNVPLDNIIYGDIYNWKSNWEKISSISHWIKVFRSRVLN